MSYRTRATDYHRPAPTPRRGGGCAVWFFSGCIFGLIGGILLVLAFATFAARPNIPFVATPTTGAADIVVTLDETYLNDLIAREIGGSYPTGIDALTLTSLRTDLGPDSRMDLLYTFHVNAGFFGFDTNARVNNRLSVDDNTLSLSSEGDPQLGDLDIPLDLLPFNLNDRTRQAIDRVNNDLLLAQLNAAARPSLEEGNFGIASVTTDASSLTLHLRER